jgi:hypothetical protein
MDIKNRKVRVGDLIKILTIVPDTGTTLNPQLKMFEGKTGKVTSIFMGIISGSWGGLDLLPTDRFVILT